MKSTERNSITFPDGMSAKSLTNDTIFLTHSENEEIPTLTRTEDLKDFMTGSVRMNDEGFTEGGEIYEALEKTGNDIVNSISNHNQSSQSHEDIRNSVNNIITGFNPVKNSEFALKLGNESSSYTKYQLDTILNLLVKDLSLNNINYVLTIEYKDGRIKEIDFPIEQTVKDGYFDENTNELVLVLVSGQEIKIPASGLVKVYIGKESATTAVNINSSSEIRVDVKQGSIRKTHLDADLAAEIDNRQNQHEVILLCTVSKLPSVTEVSSPIQKEFLSCSDTESLIKISNYIKAQTPFNLFLKIIPVGFPEGSGLIFEGIVAIFPDAASVNSSIEDSSGNYPKTAVYKIEAAFSSSETENGAAEMLEGTIYSYFNDIQTPSYIPTISTGVAPVAGSDAMMFLFEYTVEKEALIEYAANDHLIAGGKSSIYVKANIYGQHMFAKLSPVVLSGVADGIETVQLLYGAKSGTTEYGDTFSMSISVFIEFQRSVETGAIIQSTIRGQAMPTYTLNVVVTDTLASSYPDGTIVIKTE